MLESPKRVRVPDKDVKLFPHELAVTQTRTFQRLFHLKQLGLAYLVYPAAVHSRAFHSILCLDEANSILHANGVSSSNEEETMAVRMAALLHDIGHVPFSHTLEDENRVLGKHDRPARLSGVLSSLKREVQSSAWKYVESAIPILEAIASDDDSNRDWKSDLVGNTVCADLLAYITTDAQWTGIEKRPGYYRIYDYLVRQATFDGEGRSKERLCVRLTKGGLRQDVVSAILDLLDMRYALTERVIFHHAKCVASAMLARAAHLCDLTDGTYVQTQGGNRALYEIGDEVFLDYLDGRAQELKNGAERLVEGIRARRLYKRIFKLCTKSRQAWDDGRTTLQGSRFCDKWRDMAKVEEVLSGIEQRLNMPLGSLVVWCPDSRAGMKLVKSLVVWDSDSGTEGPKTLRSQEVAEAFGSVHKRVETIEQQYLGLWTFWVALHPSLVEKAAAVVQALEKEIGIPCDRLFHETHLKKMPGYAQACEAHRSVSHVTQSLGARVVESLTNKQAAHGDNASIDEPRILQAIENEVRSQRRKKDAGQMTLTDGLEQGEPLGKKRDARGRSEEDIP